MLIAGTLIVAIFGGGYAALIYHRPFKPVWAEVVGGVGGTLVGVTLLVLGLYDRGVEWLILALWASFAWTGICQIAVAAAKEERQMREAAKFQKETGPLRGDSS